MDNLNPIVLLQLQALPLSSIEPQTIQAAAEQQYQLVRKGEATYKGQPLTALQIEEAVNALSTPEAAAYHYYLAKHPRLSAFLDGDENAEIEKDALTLYSSYLADPVAQQLAPRAADLVAEALSENDAARLSAFHRQVAKGGDAFQSAVYRSAEKEVAGYRDAIEEVAQRIEEDERAVMTLRGLAPLREHAPIAALNALPPPLDALRTEIVKTIGRMVRVVADKDVTLALASAQYANQIRSTEAYEKSLNKVIQHLGNRKKRKQPRPAKGGVAAIGLMTTYTVLGFFVLGLCFAGYKYWEATRSNEQKNSPRYSSLRTTSPSPGVLISPEVEKLMLTPWPERGEKANQPPVKAEMGDAPLQVCFPTVSTSGNISRIVVVGDASADALVFFFNGRHYIRQAYIPAKSQYVLEEKMIADKLSTMIIFGKNWSPQMKSPCGTNGYFTKSIQYGGFASYATDPPYLNIATEDVLILKKARLMPSRALEANEFFDLLEKYR